MLTGALLAGTLALHQPAAVRDRAGSGAHSPTW